jgi:anthranilate phosphoribosyltransferase
VECAASVVANSIETANIGLFNGMSPNIHPRALGRILSRIHFGSTLNIAASLANPALPSIGVRGVYSRAMIRPVAEVMQDIGYTRAIVLHGALEGSDKGMDEASVCGITHCARIFETGEIKEFQIDPRKLGMAVKNPEDLAPDITIEAEARRFVGLFTNRKNTARRDAVLLNAGLIFLAAGKVKDLESGIEQSATMLEKGRAFETLENWVKTQNRDSEKGLKKLYSLV